jgi:muramoyltetrapeptide carboxypeptidase
LSSGAASAGGSVGFFAPSGFLPDPAIMERAARYFAERGWTVSAGESVFARELRFAGSDALRAGELQRFATDPALDLAIAARGGYGLSRLLGELDFEAIARVGRPLVGYSDFTAFNLALLARAGAVSYQGPAASDFFPPELAEAARREPQAARFTQEHFFAALTQEEPVLEFAGDAASAAWDGLALRGRLWGGNLSMVCSLLGTDYFPNVRGGLLFLEDVNEPAYRIERMLLQLLQAGVLGRQKAVILGEFAPVPVLGTDNGYDLQEVWAQLRARCPVPVLGGLPLGHGQRRATLAVGAPARLQVACDETGAAQLRLSYRGHPRLRAAGVRPPGSA